jgi:hypothetical protein
MLSIASSPSTALGRKNTTGNTAAKKFFGPYWEAASTLIDLENEIDSRISRYEIYQQNGTLNKHLNRRRDYERLIGA